MHNCWPFFLSCALVLLCYTVGLSFEFVLLDPSAFPGNVAMCLAKGKGGLRHGSGMSFKPVGLEEVTHCQGLHQFGRTQSVVCPLQFARSQCDTKAGNAKGNIAHTGLEDWPSPACSLNSFWIPFGDHPLKLERYRED